MKQRKSQSIKETDSPDAFLFDRQYTQAANFCDGVLAELGLAGNCHPTVWENKVRSCAYESSERVSQIALSYQSARSKAMRGWIDYDRVDWVWADVRRSMNGSIDGDACLWALCLHEITHVVVAAASNWRRDLDDVRAHGKEFQAALLALIARYPFSQYRSMALVGRDLWNKAKAAPIQASQPQALAQKVLRSEWVPVMIDGTACQRNARTGAIRLA